MELVTYAEGESWHERDVHETCPTPAEYSSSTTYPVFIILYNSTRYGVMNFTECNNVHGKNDCNPTNYCNYMVTANCGDMCADASRGCCSSQCDKFSHNSKLPVSTQCFPQYMLAQTGTCSEPYTFILDHSTCEAAAVILADEGAGHNAGVGDKDAGITDITAWKGTYDSSPYGCYYKYSAERLFFNSEKIDTDPDTDRASLCQLISTQDSLLLQSVASESADASDEEPVSDATTTDNDEEASSSVGVISAVVGIIVGVIVGAVVGVGAVVMTKQTAKESDGATVSTEVASDVQNPSQVL